MIRKYGLWLVGVCCIIAGLITAHILVNDKTRELENVEFDESSIETLGIKRMRIDSEIRLLRLQKQEAIKDYNRILENETERLSRQVGFYDGKIEELNKELNDVEDKYSKEKMVGIEYMNNDVKTSGNVLSTGSEDILSELESMDRPTIGGSFPSHQ